MHRWAGLTVACEVVPQRGLRHVGGGEALNAVPGRCDMVGMLGSCTGRECCACAGMELLRDLGGCIILLSLACCRLVGRLSLLLPGVQGLLGAGAGGGCSGLGCQGRGAIVGGCCGRARAWGTASGNVSAPWGPLRRCCRMWSSCSSLGGGWQL